LVRRVRWLIIIIGSAGAAFAAILWDWKSGAGFLVGAALSYLSFWRWKRIADAFGTTPGSRASGIMILRFALLAGAAYVIIKYLKVPPGTVLTGLLAAGAAVFTALILELIYART
jgi:hypothetical protein